MHLMTSTRCGVSAKQLERELGVTYSGLLVLLGIWTRAAAIPLLIVNLTAIASTKIPELWATGQGFWYMVTDIRTDFAMLLSLLYLFAAGSGRYSIQALLRASREEEVSSSASAEQSA